LAVLLLQAACGGTTREAETGAQILLGPNDIVAVQTTNLRTGVALAGSLNPYRMTEVRAQVSGVVTSIAADEGTAVREGQQLARIEALGITTMATGAQSGLAAAEASLALVRRQAESATTLYNAGAMSEIDYRAATTQLQAAEAQLAGARATAAGASEQASRTQVVSPFVGQVSRRSVNLGEAVNPGQTLFTVVNSSMLELRGQVPVDQATRVQEGQPVAFTIDGYPGREFTGSVSSVAPIADLSTRQVGVVMRLPNGDGALIGGMFATGRVFTAVEENVLVLPEGAVRGTGASPYVLVVENDIVTRKSIQTGTRDEETGVVVITSGLSAADRVISTPGEIQEGARVISGTATGAATESR
jgi:RND family efflux transporter MFP subunit